MELLQGDCLELMKDIPPESIDMILCDLPYGTTNCRWDSEIPLEPLWEQYNRIIKEHGAILLFGQPPFSSRLVCSNLKMFRYEWVWHKPLPLGFLNANRMPLKATENISVFYKKLPTYNPQKTPGKPYDKGVRRPNNTTIYDNFKGSTNQDRIGQRYPVNVLTFTNADHTNPLHPTQKPVPLLEYLIKTYTNPGELVLDNCMGSGSTGVACVRTDREFIGIELDEHYFDVAKERIEKEQETKDMEDVK